MIEQKNFLNNLYAYLFSFIKLLYHLYKLPLFFNYIMKSNIHYSVYNNLIFNRKYFTPYSNVPNASGQQKVILNASSYIIYDVWYPKPLYMKDKISSLEARSNNRFITSMRSMIPTEWLYWDYENIHAPFGFFFITWTTFDSHFIYFAFKLKPALSHLSITSFSFITTCDDILLEKCLNGLNSSLVESLCSTKFLFN